MKHIQFPHKQFLEDNMEILKDHPLPEMLKKRILGFQELEEDLQHTTDQDHARLVNKLEKLSHELDEDLEEYFEAHLENNEEEDEPEDKAEERGSESPAPMVDSDHNPQAEQYDQTYEEDPEVLLQVETNGQSRDANPETFDETIPEVSPTESEAAPEPTDEAVLMSLFGNKHQVLHPAKLREKGFKGSLKERTILIGNFCLRRGKYDTCYKLTLLRE